MALQIFYKTYYILTKIFWFFFFQYRQNIRREVVFVSTVESSLPPYIRITWFECWLFFFQLIYVYELFQDRVGWYALNMYAVRAMMCTVQCITMYLQIHNKSYRNDARPTLQRSGSSNQTLMSNGKGISHEQNI